MGDGTRETEVRLDGWCEGGHRQQRNDGEGFATMRERSDRKEKEKKKMFIQIKIFDITMSTYIS